MSNLNSESDDYQIYSLDYSIDSNETPLQSQLILQSQSQLQSQSRLHSVKNVIFNMN